MDSTLQLVGLHHSPERRKQVFSQPDSHFGFDPALQSFATLTPEAALAVLQSESFHAPDFAGFIEGLRSRLKLELPLTVATLRNVPLANEGEIHRILRRDLATLIAGRMPAIQTALPGLVAELLRPIHDLDRVDLVASLTVPLVAAINEILCGTAAPVGEITVSRLLDQLLAVTARKKLEAGLQSISENLKDSSSTEVMHAMVLNVLGADTLAGAMAATLEASLPHDTPMKLADIAFPAELTQTSIPYVGRIAREDTELLGQSFSKGMNLHVYFLPFTDNEKSRDLSKIFGAGRHACIGKRLSLLVWSEITRQLNGIDRRAIITNYRLRQPDYLFVFPETLEMELS